MSIGSTSYVVPKPSRGEGAQKRRTAVFRAKWVRFETMATQRRVGSKIAGKCCTFYPVKFSGEVRESDFSCQTFWYTVDGGSRSAILKIRGRTAEKLKKNKKKIAAYNIRLWTIVERPEEVGPVAITYWLDHGLSSPPTAPVVYNVHLYCIICCWQVRRNGMPLRRCGLPQ